MGLKKIFALCIALGIILVFVGCQPTTETQTVYSFIYPVQSTDKIVGTWKSTWEENFEISPTYFKNSGSWGDSYEGSATYIRYTSETSGYIYFKYTKAALPDWTYSESAPDVGKWYCVAFKSLTSNSVSLSAAAGTKTSTATLEEAVKEFTIDNGYFVIYSECELQP